VTVTLVGYDPLKDLRHRETAAARELSDWLKYLQLSNKSPRTLDAYERTAAALLLDWPHLEFSEFTDGELSHTLSKIPAKSRHQHKSHLNSWFIWGEERDKILRNPVRRLPQMRYRPNRSYDLFSEAEADAVCALPSPDGQLATIMFWTGIRLAEARHLTGKRLDLERLQIIVVDGAKGGKQRTVPMVQRVSVACAEMIDLEGIGPDDFLWYTKDGGGSRLRHSRAVSDQRFYDWWRKALETADVRYRRPHLVRHSFATRMKELGYPLEDLSQDLGHESIRTTADTYVHGSIDARGGRMRALVDG
jgi:integrase